jgi:hypothetical protein
MQTLIALLTPLIFSAQDPSSPGARRRWRFSRNAAAAPRRDTDFNPYRFLVGSGAQSGRDG